MPRADYFVGYPIEAVTTPHKSKDEGKWKYGLVLEGGHVIRIYDDKRPVPKEKDVAGDGKFIMSVVNRHDSAVEIVIGKPNMVPNHPPIEVDRIVVGLAEYSIIDQRDNGVEWFPTQALPAAELPPDPSEERAATGPQEPPEEPKKGKRGKRAA